MKKIINIIILVVMGISIVGASIFASHIPIKWFEFGIFIIVLIGAIIVQKRISQKEIISFTNKKYSVKYFIEFLTAIKNNAYSILELGDNVSSGSMINQFEETINNRLVEFEDYYMVLQHQLNITEYTNILSVYGTAERYLNRGYSAAVDGYTEETTKSLNTAIELLDKTILSLKKHVK